MVVNFTSVFYILTLMSLAVISVQAQEDEFKVVTTQYGKVRGRRIKVNDELDIEVYLGVRYAKAPIGELRFARPQPPDAWTETQDALDHGAQCAQTPQYVYLENIPFSEDCLFLDIYTPRYKNGSVGRVPTMMWIHGGSFYYGTGGIYNFTNVALRGVTVVTVNYRLDIFGFLSTQDDVIPGNFGVLDNIQALDWVKNNIAAFGGDPDQITLFGQSAGSATVSILTLSPLSRGKFQGAIMQSGVASCFWAVYNPEMTEFAPRHLARTLGSRLNCSLPDDEFSQNLLECLRAADLQVLLTESAAMRAELEEHPDSNLIWVPLVETVFGVIPDTPFNLLRNTSELVHIPTMFGYTHDDGSLTVYEVGKDGVTLDEFKSFIHYLVTINFPPDERDVIYDKTFSKYLSKDLSELSNSDLRELLVRIVTGQEEVGRIVRDARLFNKASKEDDTHMYVYEFNYRPSYSIYPEWSGVAHSDDIGFTLGLPAGPDPILIPNPTKEDEKVADFVVTTWTNFAKYGSPTPTPVHNITWPQFRSGSDERVMVIQTSPEVKDFDREVDVEVWASDNSDGNGNVGHSCHSLMNVFALCFIIVMLL